MTRIGQGGLQGCRIAEADWKPVWGNFWDCVQHMVAASLRPDEAAVKEAVHMTRVDCMKEAAWSHDGRTCWSDRKHHGSGVQVMAARKVWRIVNEVHCSVDEAAHSPCECHWMLGAGKAHFRDGTKGIFPSVVVASGAASNPLSRRPGGKSLINQT